MIKILASNPINIYIKEKFKHLTTNEMVILHIINMIEIEIDFFLYERLITYKFEKNNIILPFKPIQTINKILINIYKKNIIEEITNFTYKRNKNILLISSDILDNIISNNNATSIEYIIEYTCGYNLKEALESFPLLENIIESIYIFYLINDKFEIQNKEYIEFLKKNISLLL